MQKKIFFADRIKKVMKRQGQVRNPRLKLYEFIKNFSIGMNNNFLGSILIFILVINTLLQLVKTQQRVISPKQIQV